MIFKKSILVILGIITFQCFSQNSSYDSLLLNINNLISKSNFEEAKILIENNLNIFPSKWFELSKELIFLNNKLGNYTENIEVYKEAHQKGYFYFIHPQMPKYKPYLDFEEFDSISKIDLKLLSLANEKSQTKYEVFLPEKYDSSENYPLIFLLHGGGKNINDVKTHWQSDVLNQNFIKVYIQSYRHFDSNTFGWSNSDNKLDKEIQTIYNLILKTYKIDTNYILIGGISAGATCAIDLALRSVISIKGYIVYCPYMPTILTQEKYDEIKNTNCKGYVVAGESDLFLNQQKQMNHIFDSLNINYSYIVVRNMGHEYPKDENYYITQGINFIYK